MVEKLHGLVQVYTGDGKGKPLRHGDSRFRAVGRGLRVAVVQFMKPSPSGERIAAEKLYPELRVFGETRQYNACSDQRESAECRQDSRENFQTAQNLMISGDYDLLILDELNMVLHYEYLGRPEMLRAAQKPSCLIGIGTYRPERTELAAEGKQIS